MSKMLPATVAAGILSMLVASESAQANLVANPNFDLNSPAAETAPEDWTFTPAASGSDFFVGAGPIYGAYSAPNSANFGAGGSYDDELSQVLATTPGATYTVSFELAHTSTNSENAFYTVFGNTTGAFVNAAQFGYTLETFTATATSSSTTLEFYGREVEGWYDLDNVSVTLTPSVPEPATWAMMVFGFAGLGLAGYRRARIAAAAV